jgi:hypothetical protein
MCVKCVYQHLYDNVVHQHNAKIITIVNAIHTVRFMKYSLEMVGFHGTISKPVQTVN